MVGAIMISVHVVGLALLVGGLIAFKQNRRWRGGCFARPRARTLTRLGGVALAVLSFFASYPLSAKFQVIGLPFAVAFFEKRGDTWDDFEGPLSLPACLANAIVAFTLPQLVVRVLRWRHARASAR